MAWGKTAIRNTTQDLNLPNTMAVGSNDKNGSTRRWSAPKTSGKGACIRCGSSEHYWRQCPKTFVKELPFPGKSGKIGGKQGKGKGGAVKGGNIFLTEEMREQYEREAEQCQEVENATHPDTTVHEQWLGEDSAVNDETWREELVWK